MKAQNKRVSLRGTGEGVEWIIEFEHNIKICIEGAKKMGVKNITVGSINYLYQEGQLVIK